MNGDLAETLGTQETAVLEFKQAATDRRVIRKAICALANDLPGKGGGDLLIGVDKHGEPTGTVDTGDDALLALTNIRDEGQILDRPSLVVTAETYRAVPVVRVRVNASRTPPVRFDGVAYVRPGPTTRRATRDGDACSGGHRVGGCRPQSWRHQPGGVTVGRLGTHAARG